MVTITGVEENSAAARAGLLAGDILLTVNGHEIGDVLDYRFYLAAREVVLRVHRGPDLLEFTIRKGRYDDIGLDFATPLMDEKRSCRNKCIFCFIDQLPRGMRRSLYFKDDDSRLSFLHGNYITMTNLTERDVERMITMRFSPVNVSVHTTDPALRVAMMKNKKAGEVLAYLRRFADAGIELHGQIVLCRGVNDGAHLERTLRDLSDLYPSMTSVSVVPAGLTDHREGLYPLTPFTREECARVIDTVEGFARDNLAAHGSRIVFCSDEFYLTAGREVPPEESYEGYPQLENGVGMIRSLRTEFEEALADCPDDLLAALPPRHISLATGTAAYPCLSGLVSLVRERCPQLSVELYPIANDFFGHRITVAGLLTGRDLAAQLQGKPLGEALLLPAVTLRAEGDLFLCGMTPGQLSRALGDVPLRFVRNDGIELLEALLGRSFTEQEV